LFKKAEMAATLGSRRANTPRTLMALSGSSARSTFSSTPLRRTPSLTRNSSATVIIPLFEKPSSNSFGVSSPAQKNTTAPLNSTRPGRMRSLMSAIITSANTKITKRTVKLIFLLIFAARTRGTII